MSGLHDEWVWMLIDGLLASRFRIWLDFGTIRVICHVRFVKLIENENSQMIWKLKVSHFHLRRDIFHAGFAVIQLH